jgi:uncharacterized protein YxeA
MFSKFLAYWTCPFRSNNFEHFFLLSVLIVIGCSINLKDTKWLSRPKPYVTVKYNGKKYKTRSEAGDLDTALYSSSTTIFMKLRSMETF